MTKINISFTRIFTTIVLIVSIVISVVYLADLYNYPILPDSYCKNWCLTFRAPHESNFKCPLGCVTVNDGYVIVKNSLRIYSDCYGW